MYLIKAFNQQRVSTNEVYGGSKRQGHDSANGNDIKSAL